MQNYNEYQQHIFEPKFKATEIYQRLSEDFDFITFDKNFTGRPHMLTPRQWYGQRLPTIFSAVSFYYLEFLLRENPSTIYDIGCGWNIFKKYVPNIIGIGAEPPGSQEEPWGNLYFADVHDFVDDSFVAGHQNYFQSAFSINALHFTPLSDLKKTVDDFYSMLSPNGVGWLSLNIARMIEKDDTNFGKKDKSYLEDFVRKSLDDSKIDYLVFDLDLTTLSEPMNGNIRLVMKKSN